MLAKFAAMISTLNETNGAPESSLYIFFDMNMDVWQRVRSMLISEELVTIKGHFVTLTAKGREMAAKIDAAVSK
jgi:predicted transcriptional regulator